MTASIYGIANLAAGEVETSDRQGFESATEAPRQIVREYRRTRQAIRWPVTESQRKLVEVVYRNDFIQKLAQRSVPEILASYVYFSVSEMEQLLGMAARYLLPSPLRGIGIELGAGSGLLSSVVARSRRVEAVLAIEICERAASLLIPKVASWVLGVDGAKVIPVVGSFDDLHLPDDSIDFALEIDSFHHSDNLAHTISECARVLKPGGLLLCFDRCWPDAHPDEDLDRLLSMIYTPEFLKANGYPPGITLTRRDNGEHEYKQREWQEAFKAAGLRLVKMCKFKRQVKFRSAVKGLFSVLPASVRHLLYQNGSASLRTSAEWLSQRLKSLARIGHAGTLAEVQNWPQRNLFASRETSGFLLVKHSAEQHYQ